MLMATPFWLLALTSWDAKLDRLESYAALFLQSFYPAQQKIIGAQLLPAQSFFFSVLRCCRNVICNIRCHTRR
ncbi:hypothetical protein BJ878DRAFT_310182 [Calycina marina]|uniref:Uncharacterized protein n=1 Tax=Calycina marina TaxID=1763456 RepID=A0A9P7ZAT3_9HELO|nr:hypothetical protein BJ878DRAFT_310182 [Calycina marina]